VNDSRLRFTDKEAGPRIALCLATLKTEEVKLIVFESLANDAIGLRLTAEKLHHGFGGTAASSALVLATKADKLEANERQPRLQSLQEAAAQLGFRGVVLWQNRRLGAEGEQKQVENLKAALRRVPSTKIAALEDLRSRIKAKAEELCEKQNPRVHTENISVDKEIQVAYWASKIVNVPVVRLRKDQESYEVPYITSAEMEARQTIVVPAGGLEGLFGGTQTRTVSYKFPKPEMKFKTTYRTVKLPVTEWVDQEVPFIAYRTEIRSEMQQHQVTTYLPVSQFMAEARKLVMQEIRNSLKAV